MHHSWGKPGSSQKESHSLRALREAEQARLHSTTPQERAKERAHGIRNIYQDIHQDIHQTVHYDIHHDI
jgi:hypothetical protein